MTYKLKKLYARVPSDWDFYLDKKKVGFVAYHPDGYDTGHYVGWRWFSSHRKQWVSQREIDMMDEDGYKCAVRAKDRFDLPDAWEDLGRSRRYYVKCWKDYSKKKKQWER